MSERAANRFRSVDKTVKSQSEPFDGPAVTRGLFHPPDREFTRALEAYRDVLRAVHPLRPKHRASLPQDVKRLSESLTCERGQGPRANYLADPANLSAYLSYFLPWNLLRLGLLFRGLELDPPSGARILDLGAGPLTLAQALWMSRPELRGRRLAFVCLDQTGSVLRTGRALFEALAKEAGRAWTFELVQGPLHKAPLGPFDLVTAANCLNEAGGGRGQEGRQGLARLAELLARRLAPGGRILLAEPGTRLGGGLLGRMREELLELDLHALAPCVHDGPCPMLDPRRRSWCHFTAQAFGSPTWLGKLSQAAGLPKDRLSLSFLLMGEETPGREERLARVVSSSFALPVGGGIYGCFDQGLALLAFLRRPAGLEPGALVRLPGDLGGERDPKTGAVVVPMDREFRRERGPAGPEGGDVCEASSGLRPDAESGRRAPTCEVRPDDKSGARTSDRDARPDSRPVSRPDSRPDAGPGRAANAPRRPSAPRDFRRRGDEAKGPRARESSGERAPRRSEDGPDTSRPGTRFAPGDRDRASRPVARPRRRPAPGRGQARPGDGPSRERFGSDGGETEGS